MIHWLSTLHDFKITLMWSALICYGIIHFSMQILMCRYQSREPDTQEFNWKKYHHARKKD